MAQEEVAVMAAPLDADREPSAYLYRIDLRASGTAPGIVHQLFADAQISLSSFLARTVTTGAEVVERDFSRADSDGTLYWKGRATLYPDIAPDLAALPMYTTPSAAGVGTR